MLQQKQKLNESVGHYKTHPCTKLDTASWSLHLLPITPFMIIMTVTQNFRKTKKKSVVITEMPYVLLLSLFISLYILLHLTTMYSFIFWKGLVGRGCLYFTGYEYPLVDFSLQELTCTHCVSGTVNVHGFVWKFFFMSYIKFSFIHSF